MKRKTKHRLTSFLFFFFDFSRFGLSDFYNRPTKRIPILFNVLRIETYFVIIKSYDIFVIYHDQVKNFPTQNTLLISEQILRK